MRITLAYPHDGHQPDETITVDDAIGARMVFDGLARYPDAIDPATAKAAELKEFAATHGIDLAGTRKRDDIAVVVAEFLTRAPQPPPATGTNQEDAP